MDSRDISLNLDVGRLQKLSFEIAKLLGKGKFQSHITYGEVVEWSMRQSLKEYIRTVVRSWWVIIGFLVGLLGIVGGASGNTILLPYWVWVSIGIIALIVAQFLAYHKVRRQRDEARNEVGSVISELESETNSVGEQSINMARLFWAMGQHFLRGINTEGIFSAVHEVFERPTGEVSKGVAKAEQNLMYKLRLLQLVRDEQHQHGTTGYMVTTTTCLGDSVIKELAKKWGDSPWPPSAQEQVSHKGGSQT